MTPPLLAIWLFQATILAAPAAGETCELIVEFADSSNKEPVPGLIAFVDDTESQRTFSVVTDLYGIARFPAVPRRLGLILKVDYPGAIPVRQSISCEDDVTNAFVNLEFVRQVSLVSLIANPRSNHGLYVRVTGVLRLEFEGNALYLTSEDARHQISANGVWVQATKEMYKSRRRLEKHLVTITGRFTAENRGHMGAYAGALEDVREVARYPY